MTSHRLVSPSQLVVAIELFSMATGLNCYDDAAVVLDQVTNLVAQGHDATRIIRWLALLPRAVNVDDVARPAPGDRGAGTQMELISPFHALPESVQMAASPTSRTRGGGGSRVRNPGTLMDPDNAPAVRRRGRPATGECVVCFEVFVMNPTGRPATRCVAHRTTTKRKPASDEHPVDQ